MSATEDRLDAWLKERFNVEDGFGSTCLVRNDAEAEANARLIAAAPEMLEALRIVEAHCADPWVTGGRENDVREILLDAARAAIAKAEGR